jgi:hypothetical protein
MQLTHIIELQTWHLSHFKPWSLTDKTLPQSLHFTVSSALAVLDFEAIFKPLFKIPEGI